MITTEVLADKALLYLDKLAKTNGVVRAAKPILRRVIPNVVKKADGYLSLLADDSGNVDYRGIIDDYINDVLPGEKVDMPFLKGSTIGEGKLTLQLPAGMGKLIFKVEDFEDLKMFLIT